MARAAKEENDIYDLLFFDVAPVTLGLAIYLAVFKRGKRKIYFICFYSFLVTTLSIQPYWILAVFTHVTRIA